MIDFPLSSDPARCPTVLQDHPTGCGAASLAMILAYHRCFVSLDELLQACLSTRAGGVKASSILKAARNYGLDAKGFKWKAARLSSTKLPAIVWWEMNYFLVVEEIQGGRVFLNDPKCGRWDCSIVNFEKSYSKVALIFEPGSDFQKGPVSLNAER